MNGRRRPRSGAGRATTKPKRIAEGRAQQTLDEARMVLPGVQALFGFQLIAVFNDGFGAPEREREALHLAAIVLVTIAIALVMTPAAYHRQVDPRRATAGLCALASRLVSGAMLPLAAGMALDVHLVARLITGQRGPAPLIAGALFLCLCALVRLSAWAGRPARSARRGRTWPSTVVAMPVNP